MTARAAAATAQQRAHRARAQLVAMHLFEEASLLDQRQARLELVAGAALPLAIRRIALSMIAGEGAAAGAMQDPLRALIVEEGAEKA